VPGKIKGKIHEMLYGRIVIVIQSTSIIPDTRLSIGCHKETMKKAFIEPCQLNSIMMNSISEPLSPN